MIVSGILLKKAVDAADALEKEGIHARVLDMATIKPLDEEAVIRSARETGAIITIEDHTILGGLGSAVAETVTEHCPCLLYTSKQDSAKKTPQPVLTATPFLLL